MTRGEFRIRRGGREISLSCHCFTGFVNRGEKVFFLQLLNLEIDEIRIVKDILILYRLLLSIYIRFVTLFVKKQVKHYLISIRCM